jgi:hypothetical protein
VHLLLDVAHRRFTVITRGVDLSVLPLELLLSGAPQYYSGSARLLGVLCPSCDLGLPFSCTCPWYDRIDARPRGPIVLRVRDNLL